MRMETRNVSKRQQPDHRTDNSRRSPTGLQCSEKLPHLEASISLPLNMSDTFLVTCDKSVYQRSKVHTLYQTTVMTVELIIPWWSSGVNKHTPVHLNIGFFSGILGEKDSIALVKCFHVQEGNNIYILVCLQNSRRIWHDHTLYTIHQLLAEYKQNAWYTDPISIYA